MLRRLLGAMQAVATTVAVAVAPSPPVSPPGTCWAYLHGCSDTSQVGDWFQIYPQVPGRQLSESSPADALSYFSNATEPEFLPLTGNESGANNTSGVLDPHPAPNPFARTVFSGNDNSITSDCSALQQMELQDAIKNDHTTADNNNNALRVIDAQNGAYY